MKNRPIDVICSVLAFLATPLFFISVAVSIPAVFRPFYYVCITPLGIEEYSGYDRETIVEAYDDVMEFIWEGAEFKTGSLAWTEEEKAHFEDCVPLFHLQVILASMLGAYLLAYLILLKTKVLRSARFKGISSVSYGGILTLLLMIAIGIFAAIDFDKLFNLFHAVFFPGKGNWIFNERTEQVIMILPEEFFAVCVGFIVALVVILSSIAIGVGVAHKVRAGKREKAKSQENLQQEEQQEE
ncbi:MAG: TIGR01906 family membrane protein [Clostridia bacterium]|nr:TIGR01906 family membrane protein [Clostridia bacterium]